MKKLLLTLVVTIAFCGSIFAQAVPSEYYNPNNYPSHWAEYDESLNYFEGVDYPSLFVKIDDVLVTFDDRWYDLEFASYVGDEVRGHDFMTSEYLEYGWPYPLLEGLMVKYDNTGEEVSFRMYDHGTGIEYNIGTSNIPIVTGEDHSEIWFLWPEDFDDPAWEESAVFLLITSAEPFTRTIEGYDDPEGRAGYALIASPIGTVTITGDESPVTNLITESAYDLFYFDQNASDGLEWINQKSEGFTSLEAGKGYLYANAETTTITFDGTGNTETPEIILQHVAGVEMAGWNLVGNPYGEDAFLERPFYTMNEETGAELIEGSGAIAPMYGVFVYATEEENGQPLTFTTTGSKGANLSLNLSNGRNVIDRASVRFGEGRTLPKFQLNRNSTKVYIPVDNEDYAVVRSEGMGELPVNFKAESNGTYSLTLSAENVDFSYLHLIDNMTGADQDMLANPSYSFEAKTTDYASRFRLVFATGNDEDNFAFFSNGSLIVNNEGNATLQVVDVTGRIIKCESINGCASVNIDAASGVYMVRLVNGDNVKVQKVVK